MGGGGEGLNEPWEAQSGVHQTNYGGKMLDIWLSLKKACGWRSGPTCPNLFETWIAQVGILYVQISEELVVTIKKCIYKNDFYSHQVKNKKHISCYKGCSYSYAQRGHKRYCRIQ